MLQGRLRVFFLCCADALTIGVCWVIAVLGYQAIGFGRYAFGAGFYWKLWPVAVAFVALNALLRLYHRNVLYPAAPLAPVEELRRLVDSSLIVHLGAIAVLALMYQTTEHYSRAVIFIAGGLTAVLAQPVRDALRILLKAAGLAQIPVELIGEGETLGRIANAIERDAYIGFRVVKTGASVAVVCRDIRLFRHEISDLSGRYVHIEYAPGESSFPMAGIQAVSFGGIGALEMVNQRRMPMLRLEKWFLDRTLAVLASVALLPFFVLVPILIKLTSKGPVFYRQDRLGRNGRRIRVWKFRSMYADADERLQSILAADPVRRAEWERNFKLVDDPRVTPLGRFLRKTSIDEFPQLFNVFAGDMALVGPRPIVEREVPLYGTSYEIFSSVQPGITGLWQVSGRSETDYARRIALDVHYVLNWSPWLDIWILFRTISAVFLMRGAR